MGWGDIDKAMKARDTIERIAQSVIDRVRPAPFAAEVTGYNPFTRIATVRTSGQKDDEPDLRVAFDANLAPSVAATADGLIRGNVVEVSGRAGSLYISRITDGEYQLNIGSRIIDPRFAGGDFASIEVESNFFVTTPALPAVGNTTHLGEWNNTGKTFWSGGSAILEVEIGQELFTNVKKNYRILLPQRFESNDWETCAVTEESGTHSAVEYALEIKIVTDGFQLRIRNIRNGTTGTDTPYAALKIRGNKFYWDQTLRGTEEVSARPTEYYGRYDVGVREDQAVIVSQGPYWDTMKTSITSRNQFLVTDADFTIWDNTSFSWSGSFRAVALGMGDLASTGRQVITMPPNGTVIPVHGSTLITSHTVAGGKINLRTTDPNYTALWYEPVFFTDGSTANGRFHLVGSNAPFRVPSHWILICATNSPAALGNTLLLGSGRMTDYWRGITFQHGFTQYSASYSPCAYRKIGDIVTARGLTAGGTIDTSIFTFPAGFRPGARKMFATIVGGSAAARLDVVDDGTVLTTSSPSATYTSLECIRFEAEQ